MLMDTPDPDCPFCLGAGAVPLGDRQWEDCPCLGRTDPERLETLAAAHEWLGENGVQMAPNDDRKARDAAIGKHLRTLRETLERIARRAQSEPDPDHFAENAPDWAIDPFNGDDASTCGCCGAWLTVVRPGKSQCDCCMDGRDLGAIARAALSSEAPTLADAAPQARKSGQAREEQQNPPPKETTGKVEGEQS